MNYTSIFTILNRLLFNQDSFNFRNSLNKKTSINLSLCLEDNSKNKVNLILYQKLIQIISEFDLDERSDLFQVLFSNSELCQIITIKLMFGFFPGDKNKREFDFNTDAFEFIHENKVHPFIICLTYELFMYCFSNVTLTPDSTISRRSYMEIKQLIKSSHLCEYLPAPLD
ncbi:hypothetical protein ACYSNX_01305 [Myroides sp. LJL115]